MLLLIAVVRVSLIVVAVIGTNTFPAWLGFGGVALIAIFLLIRRSRR